MGSGLLQPTHLIIILVIVLIVFGAGKLADVGGALGKSVKEFKETATATDKERAADLKRGPTSEPIHRPAADAIPQPPVPHAAAPKVTGGRADDL